MLAYAADFGIIGHTKRDVIAAFIAIEQKSTKMGLAVNEGKTECMLSISRDVRGIFFFRLRPATILFIQSRNLFIMKIKTRITFVNYCYYLNGQLSNRDLSYTTKLILYQTLILIVLHYCAEAWILSHKQLCNSVESI